MSPSRLYRSAVPSYRNLPLIPSTVRYHNIHFKRLYSINGRRILSLIRKNPITILIKAEKRIYVGHKNKKQINLREILNKRIRRDIVAA